VIFIADNVVITVFIALFLYCTIVKFIQLVINSVFSVHIYSIAFIFMPLDRSVMRG